MYLFLVPLTSLTLFIATTQKHCIPKPFPTESIPPLCCCYPDIFLTHLKDEEKALLIFSSLSKSLGFLPSSIIPMLLLQSPFPSLFLGLFKFPAVRHSFFEHLISIITERRSPMPCEIALNNACKITSPCRVSIKSFFRHQ